MPAQTARELAKEDIVTTRRTIRRRIFCWTKGAGLADHSRSGRPSVITKNIAQYMDRMLEEDEELSAIEIHRLIARTGLLLLTLVGVGLQRFVETGLVIFCVEELDC